jgi:hypothetical protein
MKKTRFIIAALLVGCLVNLSFAQKSKDGWVNLFNGKEKPNTK